LLAWLYDVEMDPRGLRFILLRCMTVHVLPVENIKQVVEVGRFSPGSLNAYNFKNRLGSRSFQVETRRGWFTRKVLITPKDPERFVGWLLSNHIETK
jgi:hypothetical protein